MGSSSWGRSGSWVPHTPRLSSATRELVARGLSWIPKKNSRDISGPVLETHIIIANPNAFGRPLARQICDFIALLEIP